MDREILLLVGAEEIARIRARCVSLLEARRRETGTLGSRGPGWRAWFEPTLALGLGILYLAEAVARAIAATACR